MSNYENNLENGENKEIIKTDEIESDVSKNIFQTLNLKENDFAILEYLRKNPHNPNAAGLAGKKPSPDYANFGELLSFVGLNEQKFLQLLKTDKKNLAKILKSEKGNWLVLLKKGADFEQENGLEKHLTNLLKLLENN